MAWTKSLRNILGGSSQSLNNSRPDFIEQKQLSLLESSTLPAIRNETDKTQQNKLLIKKLRLCSITCDFRLAEEGGDMNEKKKIFNKTSILHEICTYLKEGYEWHTLEAITQIFSTVSKNLFRPMPDSYLKEHLMGVDHIVPITYTVPSWQHLEIIYEMLDLTFSNQNINQLLLTEYIKKYDFIPNFVYLLSTKDKNERHYLQSVLETFYNEHGNLFEKELILQLVHYCMDFIHYQVGTAAGIKSILNVFNSMSLIDVEIYNKILIPLHKMEYKYFRRYEFVLWIYCKRIIEEDETLSLILFKNLLHFWPVTNVLKEQQFLKKIAIIIDFIDEEIWQDVDRHRNPKQYQLFETTAYKILYVLQNANHYKTIIDILDIIEQEEVQNFIDKYGGQQLWCSIYQSLYDIVTYFFYFETNKKTYETMEILREQDEIPMKYINTFHKIDKGNFRMYPLDMTCFNDHKKKSLQQKRKQRQKHYDKLTKKAHSTALYKRVQKQKKKDEKERILREEKLKQKRERKEFLRKQKQERELRQNQGISTPQKYTAPPKPPPKLNNRQRTGHNIAAILEKLSPRVSPQHIAEEKTYQNAIPIMSLYNSAPPTRYKIIPKKKSQQLKAIDDSKSDPPKSFFKRSQSSGNVIPPNSPKSPKSPRRNKFWSRDRDRPNSPRKNNSPRKHLPHLPMMTRSSSEKNIEKLRKKREKEEKQRLKAEKKAEKQKHKDLEKERKRESKKAMKEIKKMEKEQKRSSKGRIRKSIDIDKRTSSITNPVAPEPDTDAFNKYNQIVNNNSSNHYLNTQYYSGGGDKHSIVVSQPHSINPNDYNKSPKLEFSYSATATYDPPNVPVITSVSLNSNNKYNHSKPSPPSRNGKGKKGIHMKAKSVHYNSNNKSIRSKTPPPPQKLELGNSSSTDAGAIVQNRRNQLAKPKPLGKNHPLHKDNKNKNKNNENSDNKGAHMKAKSVHYPPVNTNMNKTSNASGGKGKGKRRAPPRPWPPVSKST